MLASFDSMHRNLSDLVEEVFPEAAKTLVPDFKRLIAGGIDPLRPRQEMQSLTEKMVQAAQQLVAGAGAKHVARYESLWQRALSSRRVRYRIYRWLRRQPVLVLRIDGWPALKYLRLVEAQLPRVGLGITVEKVDGTLPGAVVERRLNDARASEGEARWTLLKLMAPDLFRRYESLVESVVATEAVRQGKKLLAGNPTFGNYEHVLTQNPPPFFSSRLFVGTHHFRNAFAHHHFTFEPKNLAITLRDRNWSWQGNVDDLLALFEAMNSAVTEFSAASLALFAESIVDLTYENLEKGLATLNAPPFADLQVTIDREIARASAALTAVAGAP